MSIYDVADKFYTVSNDDGIWGIFETLDLVKEAIEKHEADNGYYVKWSFNGVDGGGVAKRFDGTRIFDITPYHRNGFKCPITLTVASSDV